MTYENALQIAINAILYAYPETSTDPTTDASKTIAKLRELQNHYQHHAIDVINHRRGPND